MKKWYVVGTFFGRLFFGLLVLNQILVIRAENGSFPYDFDFDDEEVVLQAAGPTQEASLQLNVPVLGPITLGRVEKPTPGFSYIIATPQKPWTVIVLKIDQATLFVSDDRKKVTLTGTGTLLDKDVSVSLQNAAFDKTGNGLLSITLTIKFIKDKPGVEFLGQKITFDDAGVTLELGRSPTLFATATFFGITHTFSFTLQNNAITVSTVLPALALGQLIPSFKSTPLSGVNLSGVNLSVGNLFAKKPEDKAKGPAISISALSNLSGLKFSGASSPSFSRAPTTITYNKAAGFNFAANLANLTIPIPGLSVLKNAKIATSFKDKQIPQITLGGLSTLSLPTLGALNLDFLSKVGADGTEFLGTIKSDIKYQDYTFKQPKFSYSTKDKTFTITGKVTVAGVTVTGTLKRDADGKITTDVSVAGELDLDIPTLGMVKLKAVDKPQPGYSLNLGSAQKPWKLAGSITLPKATLFVSKDREKVTLDAQGTFFSWPVSLSVKDVAFDATGKAVERLIVGIDFGSKKPSLELIPGKKIAFDSGTLSFHKGKDVAVSVEGSLFGRLLRFDLTTDKEATRMGGTLPNIDLAELLPSLKSTSLARVTLSLPKITIENLFPKTDAARTKGFTFNLTGASDLSQLNFSGASSSSTQNAPTTVSYSKAVGFNFNANLADFKLPIPGFGSIKSAKLKTTFKEGEVPKISIGGGGTFDFPSVGKLNISLSGAVGLEGIDFSGSITSPLKYQNFTFKQPQFTYSSKDKTVTISGKVDFKGATVVGRLIRDAAGKVTVDVGVAGELNLNIPTLGVVKLKVVEKPQPGYSVELGTAQKPWSLADALKLTKASLFISKDREKVTLTGQGTLFNWPVTVGVKDVAFGPTGNTIVRWIVSIDFGVKKPSLEFIPGKKIVFDSAILSFHQGKDVDLNVMGALFGRSLTFDVLTDLQATKISATLPNITVAELLPALKSTVLARTMLPSAKITIENLFPKTDAARAKGFTFSIAGSSDLSQLNFSGATSAAIKNAPTTISYSKAVGFNFSATLADLKLPIPGFAIIKSAKIQTTFKDGQSPTITLGGITGFNVKGLGELNVSLSSKVSLEGIDFSGSITSPLKYQDITINQATFSYSSKDKTVIISGKATIKGVTATARLIIDQTGKVTLEGEAEAKIDIPTLGTVTLKAVTEPQPGFSVSLTEKKPWKLGELVLNKATLFLSKDKKLSLTASGTLFGKAITAGISEFKFDTTGNKVTKLTLALTFTQKPTITFIPGKDISFDSAFVTIEQAKDLTLGITTTLLGKPTTFALTVTPQAMSIAGLLPNITLGQLIPDLAQSPLSGVGLGGATLSIGNLFAKSKEDADKGPMVSIGGNTNFSSINMAGMTRPGGFGKLPTTLTFSKVLGFKFNANLPDVQLPDFISKSPMKNAKIGFDFKPGSIPTISLSGATAFKFPTIAKALDVDISAKLRKGGIDFAGTVKGGIKIGDISLPKVSISFSQADRSISLFGATIIKGFSTQATFTKSADGKLSGSAKLGDKLAPFTKIDISFLKTFAIKNPSVSFSLKGDQLDMDVQGLLDVFSFKNLSARVITQKAGVAVQASLPAGFTLSQIAPVFKNTPFDLIALKNPSFIFSGMDYADPKTHVKFKKGVNLTGTFALSDKFAPLAKFAKDSPSLTLGGYINTGDFLASTLFAAIPSTITMPGKVVKLGPLQFELVGKPEPAFGLKGSIDIQPTPKDTPVTASATVKIAPETLESFIEAEVDNWENPLGIKGLKFNKVFFSVGIGAEMLPTAVGIEANLAIGKQSIHVKGNVDEHNPMATELRGVFKGKICLTEIVKLALDMAKAAGQKAPKSKDIPDALCLNEIGATIQALPPTIGLDGKMYLFGSSAQVHYSATPLGIVASGGFTGPVIIKAGDIELIRITAAPGSSRKGAGVDFEISPSKQLYKITGLFSLFNGPAVSSYMNITNKGFSFDLHGKVGALEGDYYLSAPLNFKDPNFTIRAEMKKFMGPQIKQMIDQVIGNYVQGANAWAEQARKDCEKSLKTGTCKKKKCGKVKGKTKCAKACDEHCPNKGIKIDCPFGKDACYGACDLGGWVEQAVCDVEKFGCEAYDTVTEDICSTPKYGLQVATKLKDLVGQVTIDTAGFEADLKSLEGVFAGKPGAKLPGFWVKGKIGKLTINFNTQNLDPQHLEKLLAQIALQVLEDVKKTFDPNGKFLKDLKKAIDPKGVLLK